MKVGEIGRYQIAEIVKVNADKSIDAKIIEIPYPKNELYKTTCETKSFELNGEGVMVDGPILNEGIVLELLAEKKGELLSPYGFMYRCITDEIKMKVVYLTDAHLDFLR